MCIYQVPHTMTITAHSNHLALFLFNRIQITLVRKPGTAPPSTKNATHQNRENCPLGSTIAAPAPSRPPTSGIQEGALGRVKRRASASQLSVEIHKAAHASNAAAIHRRIVTVSMVIQSPVGGGGSGVRLGGGGLKGMKRLCPNSPLIQPSMPQPRGH